MDCITILNITSRYNMSAGNLTNSVLSLKSCYVKGVAVTGGAVSPPVISLNTLVGAVGVTSPNGSVLITTPTATSVNLETTYISGSATATASSSTTVVSVPGVEATSIIQATMSNPDQTATTYLVAAEPLVNNIRFTFSAPTSVASTAKVTWAVVKF